MIRRIKSELLKLKQTKIIPLVLALPVIYSLLFSSYFLTTSRFSPYEISLVYFELFNFAMILVAGIIIALMVEQEYLSHHFTSLLKEAQRGKLLVEKLSLISMLLSFAQLTGSGSFVLLWFLFGRMTTVWSLFILKASVLITLANLCLIPIYVLAAFLSGLVGNVCLGIVGVICSAILGGTGLGETIWPWVPFTWSRVSLEVALTLSPQLISLVGICLVFLFSSSLALIIWFKAWQGQRLVK